MDHAVSNVATAVAVTLPIGLGVGVGVGVGVRGCVGLSVTADVDALLSPPQAEMSKGSAKATLISQDVRTGNRILIHSLNQAVQSRWANYTEAWTHALDHHCK